MMPEDHYISRKRLLSTCWHPLASFPEAALTGKWCLCLGNVEDSADKTTPRELQAQPHSL